MREASPITESEWDVWRSFYAMRRQLDHALEQQLQRDAGISRPDFEILIAVFEAPERQLRVRELVERVGWEKSRVSHQLTRMEKRGLITRRECDVDGRGNWIGLTPAGSRATLGSMRDHNATIRKFFFDVLSADEIATLGVASHRVLDAIDPPLCRLVRGDDSADDSSSSSDGSSADAGTAVATDIQEGAPEAA
ncbi:MAG: MarR family transcriptional regulator [Glaciihabitans sp.]|nr:MarR family transcriptional regulator [Glaciihabitans sp.]